MSKRLTPEVKAALWRVLEHYRHDERRDWEDAERPDEHVYTALSAVEHWLLVTDRPEPSNADDATKCPTS